MFWDQRTTTCLRIPSFHSVYSDMTSFSLHQSSQAASAPKEWELDILPTRDVTSHMQQKHTFTFDDLPRATKLLLGNMPK